MFEAGDTSQQHLKNVADDYLAVNAPQKVSVRFNICNDIADYIVVCVPKT